MLTIAEILADFASYAGLISSDGARVTSLSSEGETPLHWMATLGDSRAIALLLEAGAPIDAIDKRGYTPLHCAVAVRQSNAVKALLIAGADTNIRTASGLLATDLAKQSGYQPVLHEFQIG